MPELPEVQTIINTLKTSGLLHKQITNVSVYKTKLLKNSTLIKFKKFLIGESINNITRIGKYLIFHITHNKTLVVHLRMEGKLFYEPASSSISHIHLRIKFDLKNHHKLYYYDSRIFGTFHIYEGQEYLNASHLTKLALDPLDAGFNWKYLKKHLHDAHRAIKTALLDQTNVSGIGNIYADEILFLSKINPTKKANLLKDQDFKNIAKYSREVLLKSIKYGGTTIATYKSAANHIGKFQKKLLVHTKKGEPCPVCGTKIVKCKVNGRGTYYCPNCQK